MFTFFDAKKECITKLELETLGADIMMEILYAVGFGFIALFGDRIGKFPILCKCFPFNSIENLFLVSFLMILFQ